MSAETPWGRPSWRQPRRRVGTILPMQSLPRAKSRGRWWPLWAALAGFLLSALILGVGHAVR